MISRDVEFNEEGAWNWKVDDGEKYDFLPILDEKEERYEDHQLFLYRFLMISRDVEFLMNL